MILHRRVNRLVPINDVDPWKDNPPSRSNDDRNFRMLMVDIARQGQLDPIDVAPAIGHPCRIVKGNRRYAAIRKLGWPFIDAWVWFDPWEDVYIRLLWTERLTKVWSGKERGEIILALGLSRASELLTQEENDVMRWAVDNLGENSDIFRWLCSRFGPRAFKKIRPLVSDSLDATTIAEAIRNHGSYRDLEQKGMPVVDRQKLVRLWAA